MTARAKVEEAFHDFLGDVEAEKAEAERRTSDVLLTPLQLALRWSLAVRTVQKRLAAGILPTVRFGPRLVRVRLADVEAYEASLREASPGLSGGPPGAMAPPVVPLRGGATAARPRAVRTA